MFCTNCDYEIKGEDRKECPVCGGPLIDFSEVKASSEEIPSTGTSDRWEETPQAPEERAPFDLGKALETDDEDHPLQEPGEPSPPSFLLEPEPQSETTAEEQPAEDAAATDFDKSTEEPDRWEEVPPAPEERTPFDPGNALGADEEDHPLQEPGEPSPLSFLLEPEPQSETTAEEQPAEDAAGAGFDKGTEEPDRWEEAPPAPEERTPFDPGNALGADDECLPLQEPGEPPLMHSQSEAEPPVEAVDTPRSPEEVPPDMPDSDTIPPEQIIAAAQQTELNPTYSSRKQLALSVMGVLALVAAITTIAIFKPQQNLVPDIGHLKVKTEKTVDKILSIVMQKEEEHIVTQKTSEQITPLKQRQRKHAAGKVDPDKKRSRLEKLSSGGKDKAATEKNQSKTPHRKPLVQQAADHATIASLQEPRPLLGEKDIQSLEMKSPTKNRLEGERVPVTPPTKKASHNTLYSIHAGSFKNKEVAVAETDRLKKMGFRAYSQRVDLDNGQTWHRIKIGSYSTREEAEITQNLLRQKEPKIKSYIMRRVTETHNTATKREDTTALATAEITPSIAGQTKSERPHEEPDVPERVSPLKKILTPEGEQSLPGIDAASYQTPQPGETPQTVPPGGTTLPLIKDNFVPEIEKLLTEMEGNPFTTVLAGKEIPPEDAGSIGTAPADTHQAEDHPSTGNTVSGDMLPGGKEAVTPVE